MTENNGDGRPARSGPPRWMRYSAAGFEMGGSIVGGFVAGWYLDKWLETAPVLALLGVIAGFVGGTWRLFQIAKRLTESDPGRRE